MSNGGGHGRHLWPSHLVAASLRQVSLFCTPGVVTASVHAACRKRCWVGDQPLRRIDSLRPAYRVDVNVRVFRLFSRRAASPWLRCDVVLMFMWLAWAAMRVVRLLSAALRACPVVIPASL